jgi:hypothetical protein
LIGHARADEADDLLRDGVTLRRQGKDEAALELFRRSQAARPTPRAQAQIGLAEQALARWLDAEGDVRAALAASEDDWIARNRSYLEAAQAVIADHLGELDIVGPAGAELWLNGTRTAKLPLAAPLRLAAGRVAVEIRLRGHESAQRALTIAGRSLTRETVTLLPTPPEAPLRLLSGEPASSGATDAWLLAAAPPKHLPLYKRWWLWTATAAVAVAGITVAIVLTTPKDASITPGATPVSFH